MDLAALEGIAPPRDGRIPVVMSWSGGKDSAFALQTLCADARYHVAALLTTIADEYRRISHHGVREVLLDAQAQALGLPLLKVDLPAGKNAPCTNAVYEQIMADAMAAIRARGVFTLGYGDLFLEDLRAWREQSLAACGMSAVFPIWKHDTQTLPQFLFDQGYRAILTCVEGKIGPGFAGRDYNPALIADLPPGVDPCGENGEFHTFVHDGPGFQRPVPIERGEIVCREGRFYADLLPPGEAHAASAGDIPPVYAQSYVD